MKAQFQSLALLVGLLGVAVPVASTRRVARHSKAFPCARGAKSVLFQLYATATCYKDHKPQVNCNTSTETLKCIKDSSFKKWMFQDYGVRNANVFIVDFAADTTLWGEARIDLMDILLTQNQYLIPKSSDRKPNSPWYYENWLTHYFNPVQSNLKLKQFALLGSHDALAISGGKAAQTQTKSLADQLSGGVRYFDLRYAYEKNIWTGVNQWVGVHPGTPGTCSPHDGTAFNQKAHLGFKEIIKFCETNPSEIVILRIKEVCKSQTKDFLKFVDDIGGDLFQFLTSVSTVPPSTKALADYSLKDIMQARKEVFARQTCAVVPILLTMGNTIWTSRMKQTFWTGKEMVGKFSRSKVPKTITRNQEKQLKAYCAL